MASPAASPASTPGPLLTRAKNVLELRLSDLIDRVESGDASAWPDLIEMVKAMAALAPHVAPGARGELLTTKQMAERLGIAPKTLLKRKARGQATPALQLGRRGRAAIRWKGDEVAG
jgi:hypothetical protein